jgi:hypothetical protein
MNLPQLLHRSFLPCLCSLAFIVSASATSAARGVYTSRPNCDDAPVDYKPNGDVRFVPNGMIDHQSEWQAELNDGQASRPVLKADLPLAIGDVVNAEHYNIPNAKESQFSVGEVTVNRDGIAEVKTPFDAPKAKPVACEKKK